MPVNKPVGDVATFTATVKNKEGLLLPNAAVVFTDDATDPVVVDPTNAQVGTVTGSAIETVTVTATAQGADGPISATDTADFQDNVPASVEVAAS